MTGIISLIVALYGVAVFVVVMDDRITQTELKQEDEDRDWS